MPAPRQAAVSPAPPTEPAQAVDTPRQTPPPGVARPGTSMSSAARRLDEEVDELKAQLEEHKRLREQHVAELETKLLNSEKEVQKMRTDLMLGLEAAAKRAEEATATVQQQEEEVSDIVLHMEQTGKMSEGAAKMALKVQEELRSTRSNLQGELKAELSRLAEDLRREISQGLAELVARLSETEAAVRQSGKADLGRLAEEIHSELLVGLGRGEAMAKKAEESARQHIDAAVQQLSEARAAETGVLVQQCMDSTAASAAQVAELRLQLDESAKVAGSAAELAAQVGGELQSSRAAMQGELQAEEATQQWIGTAVQEQEKARAAEVAQLTLQVEESARVAGSAAEMAARAGDELKASSATLQEELQAELARLAEEMRGEQSAGLERLSDSLGAEAMEAASRQANTADRAAEMAAKALEELETTRSALQEELQRELVHAAEEFRDELSLGLEGLASRLGEETAAAAGRAEESARQRSDAIAARLKEDLRAEADAREARALEALRAEFASERDVRDAESADAARELRAACAAAAGAQTSFVEWSIPDCLRQLAPPPERLPPLEAAGPWAALREEDAARRWLSPPFEAAGASGLQLELCTRRRAGDGSPRKGSPRSGGSPRGESMSPRLASSADGGAGSQECSAFLHAPPGLALEFRLFIGGESLSLAHSFGDGASGRCGSEQLGALGEHVGPDGSLQLGVEILRATRERTAAAPEGADLAGALVARSCVSHRPQEAAAGAAGGQRVRRVQWRVERESALLQRYSRGEAMRSAVFEAGGVQGLQMVFYPKGCEGAKEGFCSLFLSHPHWANVRCWLRAGQWRREGRQELAGRQELLGRVNFCRLQDCLDPGSSVVELAMEVQEPRATTKTMLAREASALGGPRG
ncbi:unnamed protein product, partial [Prorocentrum cordatum]